MVTAVDALCAAWLEFSAVDPRCHRGHCEVGSALVMLMTLPMLPDSSRPKVVEAIAAAGALSVVPSSATSAVFRAFLATASIRTVPLSGLLDAIGTVASGRRCGLDPARAQSLHFRSVWL